ncbi:MAG: hypothetical protein GC158_16665 [Cyanobacteria bacterium RI_101]|nr:hypothetical protein [Cyanobacteria bacterium RI_101]
MGKVPGGRKGSNPKRQSDPPLTPPKIYPPLTPPRRGTRLKVPLVKGDLGGSNSKTFNRDLHTP